VIRAVAFDLDGTLVRTEHLKALSYARALDELEPGVTHERQVVEALPDVIGRSREAVADHLLQSLGLEDLAAKRASELGLAAPRDALLEARLRIYREMMEEPGILKRYLNVAAAALLKDVGARGLGVALATGAPCDTADKVLSSIGMAGSFDRIVSGYDVARNKPAPDIYLLTVQRLGVRPTECVAIEDSRVGVEAAVTAGVWCIAVPTPYTWRGVHDSGLLADLWIVDHPQELHAAFELMVAEQA
jgi:beta-phosphoglucomutase